MLFFVIGNNLAMHFEILANRIKITNFDRNQIQKLQEDFTHLDDLTKDFNDFFYFMLDQFLSVHHYDGSIFDSTGEK
jgi:hypothetical protein